MRYALLFLFIILSACRKDETLSAYGAADQIWHLVSINGTPFDAKATITFPEAGKIAGQAPCNSYRADQISPYPWFSVTAIIATKMACGALVQEKQFFTMLENMALSEISGTALILSTEAGHEMLFSANAP